MAVLDASERLSRAALMVCNHSEYVLAAAVRHLSDEGSKDMFLRLVESLAMSHNHIMEVRYDVTRVRSSDLTLSTLRWHQMEVFLWEYFVRSQAPCNHPNTVPKVLDMYECGHC